MAVRSFEGEALGLVAKPLPPLARQVARWYLLRVHPCCEMRVMDAFQRRGIAAYLPTFPLQVRARMLHRVRFAMVTKPLFPGLILVPDYEADIDRLRDVRGVVSFLRWAEPYDTRAGRLGALREPPSLTAALFDDVRRLEALLAVPRSKRARVFAHGELVRINDGPFSGWTGRIDRLDDGGRIRVLIDAIKRGLPVNIAESQVEPV